MRYREYEKATDQLFSPGFNHSGYTDSDTFLQNRCLQGICRVNKTRYFILISITREISTPLYKTGAFRGSAELIRPDIFSQWLKTGENVCFDSLGGSPKGTCLKWCRHLLSDQNHTVSPVFNHQEKISGLIHSGDPLKAHVL